MKGVLNFAYGNSTVTTESFPNGWKDVEKNLFVNLTEANNYEVTFENKYTVVINIEIGNTLPKSQRLQGTREDQIPYYPFKDDDDNLYVYKNNTLLKRGTESEKEGYYLTGKSERYNSYEELNFTDKFKVGDKFEIYVKHCDTSGNGTMKFIK